MYLHVYLLVRGVEWARLRVKANPVTFALSGAADHFQLRVGSHKARQLPYRGGLCSNGAPSAFLHSANHVMPRHSLEPSGTMLLHENVAQRIEEQVSSQQLRDSYPAAASDLFDAKWTEVPGNTEAELARVGLFTH